MYLHFLSCFQVSLPEKQPSPPERQVCLHHQLSLTSPDTGQGQQEVPSTGSVRVGKPSPIRTSSTEEKSIGTTVCTASASTQVHSSRCKQVASTFPKTSGVAPSKHSYPYSIPGLDLVPPLFSSSSVPPHGEHSDSSHDHHQEAGEFLFDFKVSENTLEQDSLDTSQSSASTIPPLMELDFFGRHISQDQSLFRSPTTIGIPVSGSRPHSETRSLASPSFLVNLDASHSTGSDGVALLLGKGSMDSRTPFPPAPLSEPDKNTLPFSTFFNTNSSSPQLPTVGISDASVGDRQRSPLLRICSVETADAQPKHQDVDVDSDNEGGLVIDESFVSIDEAEVSPEGEVEHAEKEDQVSERTLPTHTNSVPLSSAQLHSIQSQEEAKSSDCETISVTTVTSVSSRCDVTSGSEAEPCSTPTSSVSGTPSTTPLKANSRQDSLRVSRRHDVLPASQRARKVAAGIIGTVLVDQLVSDSNSEHDLLRRLFKAVVLVTERLKWRYKSKWATPYFILYFNRAFKGFATSTLTRQRNTPTELFKAELKALKKVCGSDVSKWKEQIQRYVLLANTLPKEKKDLDAWVKKLTEPKTASTPTASGTSTLPTSAQLSTGQVCPSSVSDKPTDPRSARRHPPHTSLIHSHGASAFTPVFKSTDAGTSSTKPVPSSASGKAAPTTVQSAKPTGTTVNLVPSPTKRVVIVSDQATTSVHTSGTTSCMFKPVTTATTSDESSKNPECGVPLFAEDRSGDYSLDPDLHMHVDGLHSGPSSGSHSVLANESKESSASSELFTDSLVGKIQDSRRVATKSAGSFEGEKQTLAGEKVSMNIVLSSSKSLSETGSTIANQPGDQRSSNVREQNSMVDKQPGLNLSGEAANTNQSSAIETSKVSSPKTAKSTATSSEVMGNLDSKEPSTHSGTMHTTEIQSFTSDLATSESYDTSTENDPNRRSLSPGEIVSSSPSPVPEESRALSNVPLAYRSPDVWMSHERQRCLSRRSSHSTCRSPSPFCQRRGSSERFYGRLSRFRSRSRNRIPSARRRSRSYERRTHRRSLSHDRRSRSRDRRSHDRRRYSRSRSRGRSRSPKRRLRSRRSRIRSTSGERHHRQSPPTKRSRKQSSRSEHHHADKHDRASTDSEDELEVLKREALASMKPQAAGNTQLSKSAVSVQSEKLCVQKEVSQISALTERACETIGGGEADMDLCSISCDSAGGGEAEMDLCSTSSEEGGRVGVMDTGTDGIPGKVEEVAGVLHVGGRDSMLSTEEQKAVSGNNDNVNMTSAAMLDATTVQGELRQEKSTVDLSVGNIPDSSVVRQGQPSSEEVGAQVSQSSLNETSTVVDPNKAQHIVSRSVSAPSGGALAPKTDKQPKAPLLRPATAPVVKSVKKSLTVATTSQPSPSVAAVVSKVSAPAIQSLKKSVSCSSSRSGSKANSPALSPTHVLSPSGSTGSTGGGPSSDRLRHRSGSCVKVFKVCLCI